MQGGLPPAFESLTYQWHNAGFALRYVAMKLAKIFITCLFLTSNIAFAAAQLDCPDFPFLEPKTGPLAFINCDFHHAYEHRINQIKSTFGAPGGRPIILNLGGTLVLKYNGQTEQTAIASAPYHNIKAFGHAAFAVYMLLSQQPAGTLNHETRATMLQLQNHLRQAIEKIPSLNLEYEAASVVKELANTTDAFLLKILKQNYWTADELNSYYSKVRPLIAKSITIAAQVEISNLDNTLNRWLAQMQPDEIKRIGIVVAVSHQARAHEISLEYFAKKFGFKYGEGALFENGFIVIEDKFDEQSGLNLLARHYLDREAALIIFNNPERLQWDLLSQEHFYHKFQ